MVNVLCIGIPDRDRIIEWMYESATNANSYTNGDGTTNRCAKNILAGRSGCNFAVAATLDRSRCLDPDVHHRIAQ